MDPIKGLCSIIYTGTNLALFSHIKKCFDKEYLCFKFYICLVNL